MSSTPTLNTLTMSPLGTSKLVVVGSSPKTITAQSDPLIIRINNPGSGKNADLHFCSPHTDATIETLLRTGTGYPELAGYRTASDGQTKVYSLSSSPNVLAENAAHEQGMAIDLCPDYLTLSGSMSLQMRPPMRKLLREAIEKWFPMSADASGKVPFKILAGAITFTDGTIEQVVDVWHLELMASELKAWQSRVRVDTSKGVA
jgi:hypothetical protein